MTKSQLNTSTCNTIFEGIDILNEFIEAHREQFEAFYSERDRDSVEQSLDLIHKTFLNPYAEAVVFNYDDRDELIEAKMDRSLRLLRRMTAQPKGE